MTMAAQMKSTLAAEEKVIGLCIQAFYHCTKGCRIETVRFNDGTYECHIHKNGKHYTSFGPVDSVELCDLIASTIPDLII